MTMLQVQLLGTFAVSVQGNPVTRFRSDKIRALLIYLAVESDRPHKRDYLASLLWPRMARADALRNLRKSLSRLRRALGKEASTQLLVTTRHTLAINRAEIDVDVLAFGRDVDRVARHTHTALAECVECINRLESSLARYKGEFLSGFTPADASDFFDWMVLQREKWHQQYLSALQTLTAAYVAQEKWALALPHARQQLAAEPWREIAHRQLMQIYAGMGQIRDVQRQYEACRRRLIDELGVAPSDQTKVLYEQLVETAVSAAAAAGLPPPPKRRIKIPRQFTSFVGRETELQEINERLDNSSCALLTLLGPGGVGKTRVSIEVARQRTGKYRDGVIFVPLAPVTRTADIPEAIVDTIGLLRTGKQDSHALLLRYLREKELLLVLDNFEHLLAGANLVMEILHEAPGVQTIITSRFALNLRAEWLYELRGLSLPLTGKGDDFASNAALQLFVGRLSQLHAGDSVTDEVLEEISHVCRLVEGNPLAIELAAAHVRTSSVAVVAAALTDSLDAVQTKMADVPPRHRSLRAVFDSSWHALTGEEQAALMHLSVFAGGFSPAAALAVAGATGAHLATLQDKSFLHQTAVNRYGIHEVLRRFARERLTDAGLENRVLQAQSRYYLHHLSRRERELVGQEGKTILTELQADLANILQAWESACHLSLIEVLQQSQYAISQLFYLRGLMAQGERSFAQAVTAVSPLLPDGTEQSATHLLFAQLLNGHARFLLNMGQPDAAESRAGEALAVAQAGGLPQEEALALMQIGIAHTDRGDYESAHRMHDRAGNILEELAGKSGCNLWRIRNLQADNYKQKCDAYWAVSDFDQARECLEKAVALDKENEDVRGEASCLHRQGIISRIQGDYDRAIDAFRKGIALAELAGASQLQQLLQNSLALSYSEKGDHKSAAKFFKKFYQTGKEIGDHKTQLTALTNLGLATVRQGAYLEAKAYYEQALTIAMQVGGKRQEGILLGNLGIIAMRLGDFAQAARLFADSLEVRLTINDRRGEMYARFYIARLALYQGDFATAVSQSRQVLDLAAETAVRDIDNFAHTSLGHAYVRLKQLDLAKPLYQKAIERWQKTGQDHLLAGPMSGLARIALLEGELDRAVKLCNPILEKMVELDLESTFEPFDIWLVCIEVLFAAGDERAQSTLREAYGRLQARAASVSDPEIKARFLWMIDSHREIVRLADENQISAFTHANPRHGP